MSFTFSDKEPDTSSWQSLEQHQSATPASFVEGPPVLHAQCAGCHAVIDNASLSAHNDFRAWFEASGATDSSNGHGHDGANNGAGAKLVKEDVNVWVTTEALVLCSTKNEHGALRTVNIPYPSISLHATQRSFAQLVPETSSLTYHNSSSGESTKPMSSLYFQLDPLASERGRSNPNVEDIEGTLDLLIVPPPHTVAGANGVNGSGSIAAQEQASVDGPADTPTPNQQSVNELYSALNACADLWPDEDESDEGGGEIPVLGGMTDDAMLGESDWITSENADQYQDQFVDVEEEIGEDGTVRFLGPGAGTRRGREPPVNGDGATGEAAADGDAEETKWQRTS